MANEVQYILSLKDLLTPAIENADRAANKLEGTMGSVQRGLTGIAAAAGIAFGIAGVVQFTKSMITAGSTVENAKTGLTTLLKDAAEAQQVIQNTMVDAMKTPFAFEGLLGANKALISAGVSAKNARTDVLNLSNAIAATGGGDAELQRMIINMQQIKNIGHATAVDIKQFGYAGINIYQALAAATGKSVNQVKDMTISYDLLSSALAKAHAAGGIYANGLENMAGNTSVRISNLGDAVFQLSVQIFNDLKPAIDAVLSSLSSMIGTLKSAWEWAVRNKETLKEVGTYLLVAAGAWGTYKLVMLAVLAAQKAQVIWSGIQYAAISVLGDRMLVASVWTTLMAAAQWALNVAMTANPIGAVIVAIAAVTAGIIWAYKHFGAFRAVLWSVWETVKEFGRIVGDIFTGLWKIIHGVFTLSPSEIKLGGAQMVDAMFNAGQRLGAAAKRGYEAGMADFNSGQKAETKPGLVTTPKSTVKTPGTAAPVDISKGSKATGSKNITFNIKIGNVVGQQTFSVTNVKETMTKVREQMTAALISSVNDFQIVSGE